MKVKYIYACAALLLGLTACSNEDFLTDSGLDTGKTVHLRLTANRSNSATRSILSENTETGGLNDLWTEDDVLYVMANDRGVVGSLKFEEYLDEENKNKAVFSGNVSIEDVAQKLFVYQCDAATISSDKKTVSVDLRNLKYHSVGELSAIDMLYQRIDVEVTGENAIVTQDATMIPHLAMAHFSLDLPSGVTGTLYISDSGKHSPIWTKARITTYPNDVTVGFEKIANVTEISAEVLEDHQVYMALPAMYSNSQKTFNEVTLSFRFVASNGDVYTYAFDNPTEIEAGVYYCGEDGRGFEIPLVKSSSAYRIIFKENPEALDGQIVNPLEGSEDYETDLEWVSAIYKEYQSSVLSDPEFELPGNPKPESPRKWKFKGWVKEGVTKDENPQLITGLQDLTPDAEGQDVVLVPVYEFEWTIEWRDGYSDGDGNPGNLVEYQGQTVFRRNNYVVPTNNSNLMTPYALNGKDSGYEPVREGLAFIGWEHVKSNGEIQRTTPGKEQVFPVAFKNDNFEPFVVKAVWGAIEQNKRQYEIVYHFDSADPTHSHSGGCDKKYNAQVIDRPVGVENGYNYKVIDPSSPRFANQGRVKMTDAKGRRIIGWRKYAPCDDDYSTTLDAADCARIVVGGDTWTFTDGKSVLHLEPVYGEYSIIFLDEGEYIQAETISSDADEFVFVIKEYVPTGYEEYGWTTKENDTTPMTSVTATKQKPTVYVYPVYSGSPKSVKSPGYSNGSLRYKS